MNEAPIRIAVFYRHFALFAKLALQTGNGFERNIEAHCATAVAVEKQ
jgi:hypothetical protein